MDHPERYGHDRKAVPYPAGIIIPILFFSVAFAIIPETHALFKPLMGFSIASAILVTVSFIDDLKNLSPFFRLGIHFFVALIIVASGIGIDEIRVPLGEIASLHIGSFSLGSHTIHPIADILAVFWIVGMMNAMNWLDGISGLTSSVSLISSAVLAFTAYFFGQADVAMLFGILSVICGIFFLFDLESPKILMGDSGSMFLGLALAVFTIIAGGKVATAMLVMFVPLFDAMWTIARRIINKKSPFKGDLEHFHHNLLKLVGSRRNTVLIYAFFTALFGFTALFLKTEGKIVLFTVLFIFMAILELRVKR